MYHIIVMYKFMYEQLCNLNYEMVLVTNSNEIHAWQFGNGLWQIIAKYYGDDFLINTSF